jgi:hypothetical protein
MGVQDKPTSQRIALEARVLSAGIRQASARSDEPLLCIARGNRISFVAVSGLRLVASWEFPLPRRVDPSAVLVIPPMIVNHLLALPSAEGALHGPGMDMVDLILSPCDRRPSDFVKSASEDRHLRGGDDVALITHDELGYYELHWRSDPRAFPAPPQMSRLLIVPTALVRLSYVQVSDAVHQAVIQLVGMESQHQIHRTKLAIMVSLADGHLMATGQEIGSRAVDQYYFDPRLVIRALEMVKAEYVELGLTVLGPKSAFLSIVNRFPVMGEDCVVHCALLSIGLDTQRLFPLPRGRGQATPLAQG